MTSARTWSAPRQGYVFQRMLEENVSFTTPERRWRVLSPFRTGPHHCETAEMHRSSIWPDRRYESPAAATTATSPSRRSGHRREDRECLRLEPTSGGDAGTRRGPTTSSRDSTRRWRPTRFRPQLHLPALERTRGATRKATPDADVASNDWAFGQIVDEISHSSIWNNSLIRSSRRFPGWCRPCRRPPDTSAHDQPLRPAGTVIRRDEQLSFLRTLEIISGMRSLNLARRWRCPSTTPSRRTRATRRRTTPSSPASR